MGHAPKLFLMATAGRASALWRNEALRWLTLFAAVFLAYAPTLGGGFLWDDEPLIVNNRFIRSPLLAGEAFRHPLFAESLSSLHYRPIQTLSYQADYWLWGLNPYGYHFSNLLAQSLCAGLLYALLRTLLGELRTRRSLATVPATSPPGPSPDRRITLTQAGDAAFLLALLWAVHPAHNAAVAYVAGRADPMAFAFAALSWLSFWWATQPGRSRTRRALGCAGGALSLFGALGSRESGVCWLVLMMTSILFLDPRERRARGIWIGGACAVALGGYLGLRLSLPAPDLAPPPPGFDWPGRILLMLRALGEYAQTLLWPAKLTMDRRLGCEDELLAAGGFGHLRLWLAGGTLAGTVLLVTLLAGVWKKGAGQSLRRFGGWWFLVGFLPVSNLFPLNATVADHWLYLPSVGLLLVAAGWWREIPGTLRARLDAPATALIALAALALMARTYLRSTDWLDARAFYQKTIADGGDSARMRYNLANACRRAGDTAAAEDELSKLLARSPGFLPARLLLDRLLAIRGGETPAERCEALRAWRERLRGNRFATGKARPEEQQLTLYYVGALARAGRLEEALGIAQESIDQAGADKPDWPMVSLLASLLDESGQTRSAAARVAAFTGTHWWHKDALLSLANLQIKLGEEQSALVTLAAADRLDVRDATALNLSGALRFRAGNLPLALACQQAALAKAPGLPRQHELLGVLYAQLRRQPEAEQQFQAAARLQAEIAAHSPARRPAPEGSSVN